MPAQPDSAPAPGPERDALAVDPTGGSALDRALRGSLPCLGCEYELQGLSVRGQCPECGLAIRATILHQVDPHADVFEPLRHPALTATAIALWPGAAFIAVLAAWTPRLHDALAQTSMRPPGWLAAGSLVTILGAAVSGFAALALLVTTSTLAPLHGARARMRTAIGVAAYIPLIAGLVMLYLGVDAAVGAPYFEGAPREERLAIRLSIAAFAVASLLGLRPMARQLVSRSLVLRTGRVDRQTVAATAAALVLAAAGDVLRFISIGLPSNVAPLVELIGTVVVMIGSAMITLAVAGAAMDGLRIRRAIRTPSPSLRQVLGDSAPLG